MESLRLFSFFFVSKTSKTCSYILLSLASCSACVIWRYILFFLLISNVGSVSNKFSTFCQFTVISQVSWFIEILILFGVHVDVDVSFQCHSESSS